MALVRAVDRAAEHLPDHDVEDANADQPAEHAEEIAEDNRDVAVVREGDLLVAAGDDVAEQVPEDVPDDRPDQRGVRGRAQPPGPRIRRRGRLAATGYLGAFRLDFDGHLRLPRYLSPDHGCSGSFGL